jgi:eukaryotic-like serine/threonine-protein kinase
VTLPDRVIAALADRYSIVRELGAGGMATVYLAEDLRHRRNVAIKVLREDLSASVGATRFLREIEIAAQLQHPNILPLLDSGSADGRLFYVMPFMEGQSLRQRLNRERELPVHEAVRLLTEIVDALAHAHQHGVVHRDIKPDNVMLSGRHAVVADFGIARAVSESAGTSTVTSMGMAIGTPAYMAPEQATADPAIDKRADIYADGVVAYELLTGRPLFLGMTPQQVLAAHVTQRPDPLSQHRPGVSPALELTIMRCLEKRPADRWQTADELLAALEPLATPSGGSVPTSARLAAATAASTRRLVPAAIGIVVLVAAAIGVTMLLQQTGAVEALGRSEALTTEDGLEVFPEISPDGKFVAYSAGNSANLRVFVRPVGGGRAIPLSVDTSAFEYQPRWSPDGKQMLFLTRNGGISVAPAFGEAGTGRVIVPSPTNTVGALSADWSPSGDEIAFVRSDTLSAIKLDGTAMRVITVAKDLNACVWSPDTRWIVCAQGNSQFTQPGILFGNVASSALVLVPAAGGAVTPITDAKRFNHSPAWSRDGRRVFFVSNRDGPRDIYVVDVSDGRARGDAERLSTGLSVQSVSLSEDGEQIAYSVYRTTANIWSVPFPKGAPMTTDDAVQVTSGNQIIEVVNLTNDGRWLVYDSNIRGNFDIWRIPVGGGPPEQLTSEPFDEFAADPSPDGTEIAYHAFRTPGLRQIEVKSVSGGPVERVTATTEQESNAVWSPDGKRLASFVLIPPFWISVSQRTAPGQWTPPRRLGYGFVPQWLSDSTLIWGALDPIPGRAPIVVRSIPADSGESRLALAFSLAEGVPSGIELSRDGRRLYVKKHDQQGRTSIWSHPLDGGQPKLLMRFPDLNRGSFRPSFTTDEKRIYFTIDDRQSDIFVAEVTKR